MVAFAATVKVWQPLEKCAYLYQMCNREYYTRINEVLYVE